MSKQKVKVPAKKEEKVTEGKTEMKPTASVIDPIQGLADIVFGRIFHPPKVEAENVEKVVNDAADSKKEANDDDTHQIQAGPVTINLNGLFERVKRPKPKSAANTSGSGTDATGDTGAAGTGAPS